MNIVCSNNLFINDNRKPEYFKKILYGNYDKSEVVSTIEKKILQNHYESSCYLAYILLISGHLKTLWDKLTYISYKKIRNYHLIRWIYYKNITIQSLINKYKKPEELMNLRNSQLVRNIITEMIILMISSTKKDVIETLRTKPNLKKDFNIENVYKNLKNKNNIIIADIIGPNDPKEVCYVLNEFAHCINNKNVQKAFYWLEWVILWDKENVKKYKKFEVQSRNINGIEPKYQTNVIWFIWGVILFMKNIINDKLKIFYGENIDKLNDTLDYIWMLYLYEWKPVNRNKKMMLIYLYINYLLNPQDLTSVKMNGSISNAEYLKLNIIIQEKLFTKLKEKSQIGFNIINF